MRVWRIGIAATGFLACLAIMLQMPASSQPVAAPAGAAKGNVTQARLLSPTDRANNWLVYGGNFESQHFSPLKAINDKTGGGL